MVDHKEWIWRLNRILSKAQTSKMTSIITKRSAAEPATPGVCWTGKTSGGEFSSGKLVTKSRIIIKL